MIVGIDIGSTTTKAVALQSKAVLYKMKTKAYDAVTSATGILGKLTIECGIEIKDIEKIIITGAGASRIHKNIFNIPTEKTDEISAIGYGGRYLSNRENGIITNIGTGTAIIQVKQGKIYHIGGTGVGGGTIIGLSKELLSTTSFSNILNLAEKGDLKKVDLVIEDIVESNISFLKMDSTASNFGKMLDTAQKEDIAIGIINLVYQVIGMLSVFAAKGTDNTTVVVTGNGSNNLLGQNILKDISGIYKIEFVFPGDAEFATAIGAALSHDIID
jgi:type II pantothenate kinase